MPKRKPRQSVDQTDGAPLRRSSRRKTSSSTPATTLASASVAPRQEVKTAAASARTAGKPPARKSAQDRANKVDGLFDSIAVRRERASAVGAASP